jgi:hypothetical protein
MVILMGLVYGVVSKSGGEMKLIVGNYTMILDGYQNPINVEIQSNGGFNVKYDDFNMFGYTTTENKVTFHGGKTLQGRNAKSNPTEDQVYKAVISLKRFEYSGSNILFKN